MSRHHHGARLDQFVRDGHQVLALENEQLRVELLPDKGSDITSFLHKPTDTDFLLRTRLGLRPRHEMELLAIDPDATPDLYEGGWQECLPNGGPATRYRGATLPFHGELWRATWTVAVLVDSPELVQIRLLETRTHRSPYRLEKVLTVRSGAPVLTIDERLENESDLEMRLMWGHHPCFGPPFLDDSCRIDLPAARASTLRSSPMPDSRLSFGSEFNWPEAPLADGGTVDLRIVPPPGDGSSEWVRLSEFDAGWFGLTNQARQVGFGLRWDARLFRHLWLWREAGGGDAYPWYGRAYSCALEPWTSWPDSGLAEAEANGSALVMAPRSVIETRLVATAYAGRSSIRGIGEDGSPL